MARKPKKSLPVEAVDAELDPMIEKFLRRAQINATINGTAPINEESFRVAMLLHELKVFRLASAKRPDEEPKQSEGDTTDHLANTVA